MTDISCVVSLFWQASHIESYSRKGIRSLAGLRGEFGTWKAGRLVRRVGGFPRQAIWEAPCSSHTVWLCRCAVVGVFRSESLIAQMRIMGVSPGED